MTQLIIRWWIAAASAVLMTGCGVTMMRAEQTPTKRPSRTGASAVVALHPIALNIQPGTKVGGKAANPNRVYTLTHFWGETLSIDRAEFNHPLRDELTRHGYVFAVGQRAQVQLKPTILSMVFNLFGDNPKAGWSEASVEVRWVLDGPTPLTFVTKGYASTRQHSYASVFQAFRASLSNLLSEPRIAQALARTAQAVVVKKVEPKPPVLRPEPIAAPAPVKNGVRHVLKRPGVEPAAADDDARVARLRNRVVTILAGDHWGSGTVLSADGYILTTAALVKDREIRVVPLSGEEIPAKVIATDAATGIALIKASHGTFEPMRINLEPATAKTALVAIGTPFHEVLSFSVSRGKLVNVRGDTLVTDVRVSVGNSGGPLVGPRDEAVGLVVWPAGVSVPAAKAGGVSMKRAFAALGIAYGG